MKKTIAATAVAVAALFTPVGVGMTIPTAYAYTVNEEAFLEVVRDYGITGTSDALLRMGRAVCTLRTSGYSDDRIAQEIADRNDDMSILDGYYLVGAAQAAFCPEVAA